jgi:hypothetical protein
MTWWPTARPPTVSATTSRPGGYSAPGRRGRSWERAVGAGYHPWGDVVTVIGFLDDLRDDCGSERPLVEGMLAHAVTDLAG